VAGDGELNSPSEWFARHTSHAPPVLRERVLACAGGSPATPAALASAARRALARVLASPGDRAAALDLLAADGLITLALLAQAETDPAALGAFAASLLDGERTGD